MIHSEDTIRRHEDFSYAEVALLIYILCPHFYLQSRPLYHNHIHDEPQLKRYVHMVYIT